MDEAINQLRYLLKEAKTRLFHAEHVIEASSLGDNLVAKNYVEKHYKEILALRNEFGKSEVPTTIQDELSNGSTHTTNGRFF